MVLVPDLERPHLDADDRHHLARVLRLRDGAPIVLCDGHGSWRTARFGDEVTDLGPVESAVAPTPPIGVGFALVKGERPELIVQKLTELGVDVIAPFVADRSVVRWDAARASHHHERLVKVARGACAQSRRPFLPHIEQVVGFDELVDGLMRRGDEIALADMGSSALSARPAGDAARVVLVGPEGGWTDAEQARVTARAGLGPYVLRAETAAIAAGVILATHRHGG